MDQDATRHGARPRSRRLCVTWEPRSSPQKGGQTAGWIKMVLGMEIGLSPGDLVLHRDPARSLNFRPMFIMVALCNRADHYIFALLFLSIYFLFLFLA